MEESKENLGNIENTDNSQFVANENAPVLWFEKDVKKIFGETDLIGLFEKGFYNSDEGTINGFYDYLRRTEPFCQFDELITIYLVFTNEFAKKPSKEYLPYYADKKKCYCCLCLGWMSLTKILITHQNDETILNQIKDNFGLHLPPKDPIDVFEETVRAANIVISYQCCDKLLNTTRFNPLFNYNLKDKLQQFELFMYETASQYKKCRIRDNLDNKEQQIQTLKQQLNKTTQEIQDNWKRMIQLEKDIFIKETSGDILSNLNSILTKPVVNDNSTEETQKKSIFDHFANKTSYQTIDGKAIPFEELYAAFKNQEKIKCGCEVLEGAIKHGDFSLLFDEKSDLFVRGSKTYYKILAKQLFPSMEVGWFESVALSCFPEFDNDTKDGIDKAKATMRSMNYKTPNGRNNFNDVISNILKVKTPK